MKTKFAVQLCLYHDCNVIEGDIVFRNFIERRPHEPNDVNFIVVIHENLLILWF